MTVILEYLVNIEKLKKILINTQDNGLISVWIYRNFAEKIVRDRWKDKLIDSNQIGIVHHMEDIRYGSGHFCHYHPNIWTIFQKNIQVNEVFTLNFLKLKIYLDF